MGLASMSTYVEQREGGFYIAGTRISLDSIIHAFQDRENLQKEFCGPFRWPVPLYESTVPSRSTSNIRTK